MITAVDIGGTKTLVAQFSSHLQPVNEVRFPTPQQPADFLRELQTHLAKLSEVSTLSVAVPGIIAPDGTVLRCANLPWRNVPLRAMLQATYQCPVFIENDANLAGLAEMNTLNPIPHLGIYLTVSTGIGSGVIIDGRLPAALSQAEAGHMVLQFNGEWRQWEDFASGKALSHDIGKLAKDFTTPEEWQTVAERLTIGLSALIPAFQPDVIVFGGGVGDYLPHFHSLLIEQLTRRISPYIQLPHIVPAQHPTEAVLYGCYYYATHQTTSN